MSLGLKSWAATFFLMRDWFLLRAEPPLDVLEIEVALEIVSSLS